MEWMLYVVAVIFCVLGAACVLSIIIGLPGGWIMLGLAMIIQFADRLYLPAHAPPTFGWWMLGACVGLLALGELIELAAGAAGARRGGGGRRGMVGALIGGIAGAVMLTLFLPIPLVGTLIGAVLGTFAGAVVGEVTGENAKTVRGSMKPALGATIGRVVGTVSKVGITIAVWITLSVAAFV